jgi:hypothetical protein
MNGPPQANHIILFLPDALHFYIKFLEKQIPVKSQAPENYSVVLQANKMVPWISENDVFSVDVICTEIAQGLARIYAHNTLSSPLMAHANDGMFGIAGQNHL